MLYLIQINTTIYLQKRHSIQNIINFELSLYILTS